MTLIQTEARIYLASQRGYTETADFRSLHTFNFVNYNVTGRDPFGSLTAFNNETLAAGKSFKIVTDKPTEIILLPVAGGLEVKDSYGESVFVGVGESFRFLAFPESDFTILNPYETETINYLQIHIRPGLGSAGLDNHLDDSPVTRFSLEESNLLIPVFSAVSNKVNAFIGQFGGRQEGKYHLQDPENGMFIYIIGGAFEVQNRLLETGDALTLQHVEEIDFEALSNGALILVMEVGG